MSLQELRRQIDALDAQILDLLTQRAHVVQEVGHSKTRTQTKFFSPERERQIFERLEEANQGPLPPTAVRAIFREILSGMRALEAQIRVAHLGPAGTFSHQAALDKFGTSSELKAADTIPDVFALVERGEADYGVVPVENSTEGIIPYTLDMFHEKGTRLKICAEVYVPVVHNLASNTETLSEIQRLYAHPQAYAQSRNWIRDNLGTSIEVIDATSNSKAATLAAADPTSAAITTSIASELYGIPLLAQHIEDSPHNATRFLVIGHKVALPTGRDKTSILFSVKDKVGALYEMLQTFKQAGLNLTKIESRPTKKRAWEYIFFVDFLGHQSDAAVKKALGLLSEQCTRLKILGSYPVAVQ